MHVVQNAPNTLMQEIKFKIKARKQQKLFFNFFGLFRQNFNMFKDLSLESRNIKTKIVRLSSAQFSLVIL